MVLSPAKWNRLTLLIVVALLVGLPLLIDHWYSRLWLRKDLRDDELVQKYECEPPDTCVADFNGDRVADSITVGAREFVVKDATSAMLRMPYDHTDNTLRTHFAITNTSGKSRLLIYDGASHSPHLSSAFAWNGRTLQEVQPSDLEREILSAMAAHDDTGGWSERAFRPLFRSARLFGYYFALAITIAFVIFKRYRKPATRFA